jgi:hypothetical protein
VARVIRLEAAESLQNLTWRADWGKMRASAGTVFPPARGNAATIALISEI